MFSSSAVVLERQYNLISWTIFGYNSTPTRMVYLPEPCFALFLLTLCYCYCLFGYFHSISCSSFYRGCPTGSDVILSPSLSWSADIVSLGRLEAWAQWMQTNFTNLFLFSPVDTLLHFHNFSTFLFLLLNKTSNPLVSPIIIRCLRLGGFFEVWTFQLTEIMMWSSLFTVCISILRILSTLQRHMLIHNRQPPQPHCK